MAYRTETDAWEEDTKTIQEVEQIIEKEGLTEGNHFDLFSKISDVSDRTSLDGKGKYWERMIYCEKLMDKILKVGKKDAPSNRIV